MITFLTRIISSALAFIATVATAADYYVAPNGSDANPGTQAKPFASPQHARDAIRAAKQQGDRGPFSVQLAGGLYPLTETLALTAEDSGTKAAPVVWRSAPNEQAVLTGGRVLSGLRESTVGGVRRWTVALPEVKSGALNFRQLFVSTSGQPYQRRYRPQIGMKRVDGLTYSPKRQNSPQHRAAQKDFYFAPGDFKPWENLSDVEVVVLHVWSSSRLLVEKVDSKNNIVTFTGLPTFAVNQGWLQPYFIENVKAELKSPGEWYLDRPTGVLTYLPCASETLANSRIVIPRLVKVMTLTGDYPKGSFVEHLTFDRVAFSHNESPLPHEGYGGSQGNPDLPAAIELTGAKDCTFQRCTVSQTGNYGLGLGLGSQNNAIVGCRLFDLGGGGIKVGDIRMKTDAKYPELPTGNRIENCAISDGGIMYFSGNAVWGGIVRDTVVRHNQIWNFSYSGIAFGWLWSDTPTSCASNRIEYNSISNVLTLIADGASIYTLGRQPGTVIRDNVKSPFAKQYWQLGLYLDEGSSEMLVENNLVYRVGTHGFNMNGGAQNVIRNNILGPVYVDPAEQAPYVRCHKSPYAHSNVFTRNLMYFDSVNMADAAWDKSLLECRENIYWNYAGKPFRFMSKTFAEWQAGGQDAGSLNVDPLFEDPVHGNFRLKKTSPAFALGFKEFDIAAAGLEPGFKSVATPAKTTPPPVYAMKFSAPRPFAGFSFDFDDIPVGMQPRGFSVNGATPEADFKVGEGVGKNRGRALVATDRKNAQKSFYPYLTYNLPDLLEKGTVVFSCDVMPKVGAPVTLAMGFRDYSKRGNGQKEFIGTPEVVFTRDGQIKSGSAVIASAVPDGWTNVEISFPLAGAAREARIVVTLADGVKKVIKSPVNPELLALSSLGFYLSDAVDGVCYLDNLQLTIK
ncbi:MAG: right-handed parallel beta-helix repeat-containing protein [Luteolibacter sp.]|jgi:hypothetical protein|nr:right-handed parallel beta-helix repeat-containing protein [Luteolibacter sp.]